MAAIESTESATAQTATTGGQGGRHRQRRSTEKRSHERKGHRPVVQRDAAGGGDATKRQIHHLRSQGEAISEGHTQSVVNPQNPEPGVGSRGNPQQERWLIDVVLFLKQNCPNGPESASGLIRRAFDFSSTLSVRHCMVFRGRRVVGPGRLSSDGEKKDQPHSSSNEMLHLYKPSSRTNTTLNHRSTHTDIAPQI